MKNQLGSLTEHSTAKPSKNDRSLLGVLVNKEIASFIRSWRFIVMALLIILTFMASMYVSMSNIKGLSVATNDPASNFIYLKLLTATDQSIPPFHVFLNFLAPLLGIGLGFDAINTEKNTGTLTRLLAQPIYRDNLLIGKFLAPLLLVGVFFAALTLLMIGAGIWLTGVAMEPQELFRLIGFIGISILYVGFWLSLSILLSVLFTQPSTAAITAFGIWLFFTIFFPILINLLVRSILPHPQSLSETQYIAYNELILSLHRISPGQLYSDATTTLLMPSVRSLGPISMEQSLGALPSNLRFSDSLLMVWPQITGLIAATALCFSLSYYLFMRKEIRS